MGNVRNTTTATATASPRTGRSKFILLVLVIVMVLDFVSFGSYWLGHAIASGDWMQMGNNLRAAVWPEFLSEAEYYARQNLPTVNMVLDKYLDIDRGMLGNAAPFVDYFFQKLFRIVGFLTYMSGGVLIIFFALAEGYRKNQQKWLEFKQHSATAYHFTLYAGGLFVASFFFLCVFMPSKLVIPGVFKAQVPLFLCSPFFWAVIMTVIAGLTIYWMVANFTNA